MAAIQTEFDRIALVSDEGWSHNAHYHKFLLQHVPSGCREALEIGCGTGAFSRALAERAQHVIAFDLSPEMIRIAQSRSLHVPNLDFQLADVMSRDLPAEQFDCIGSLATLHHVPLRSVLLKLKESLRPGGVLLVLDLFERERNVFRRNGLRDWLLHLAAIPLSVGLRLLHTGRLLPPREVRAAWAEHEKHDVFPAVSDVRELCAEILPGAKVTQHLFWRYSIVWRK
jgi:SAM-dependent methyltransferase